MYLREAACSQTWNLKAICNADYPYGVCFARTNGTLRIYTKLRITRAHLCRSDTVAAHLAAAAVAAAGAVGSEIGHFRGAHLGAGRCFAGAGRHLVRHRVGEFTGQPKRRHKLEHCHTHTHTTHPYTPTHNGM